MFPKFSQKSITPHYERTEQDDVKDWQKFQLWYETALGKKLAQREKEILEKCLPNLFGYYLLQCGCPEVKLEKMAGSWLKSSRVSSQICLDYESSEGVHCQSHLAHLPMKSDSLDIVVLPHVLEFSSSPHQVLREVERVLIAEGHVVILGFNPWSIWNVFRLFLFWRKQAPWNAHFLAASRVMDWLVLLGFDVVERHSYFYQFPVQSENMLNKMSFLEKIGQRFCTGFGGSYAIVARKRVQTLTPIRPRWQRARRKVISGAFEPTNRNRL